MIMTKRPETERVTLTGFHVALMFAGFFGVVIAVNLGLAAVAGLSWTGLVVENSYVESQRYNTRIAAAREQAARGWRATLATHDRRLTFELRRQDGIPIALTSARLTLQRPVGTADDRMVAMRISGHRATFEDPLAPGTWNASIKAVTAAGADFRLDQRIELNERQ